MTQCHSASRARQFSGFFDPIAGTPDVRPRQKVNARHPGCCANNARDRYPALRWSWVLGPRQADRVIWQKRSVAFYAGGRSPLPIWNARYRTGVGRPRSVSNLCWARRLGKPVRVSRATYLLRLKPPTRRSDWEFDVEDGLFDSRTSQPSILVSVIRLIARKDRAKFP